MCSPAHSGGHAHDGPDLGDVLLLPQTPHEGTKRLSKHEGNYFFPHRKHQDSENPESVNTDMRKICQLKQKFQLFSNNLPEMNPNIFKVSYV